MSFEADNEILQDFLIEAGEILENLAGQLVDLEHSPTDRELLNAVFRGFHTVKGGAGFLNITPLVEVCHRAEDVFNVLRQGQRVIDADLMDVVLRVTDVVNGMMESIRANQIPEPADPALLKKLTKLAAPQPDNNKIENIGTVKNDESESLKEADYSERDAVEEKFEELLGFNESDAQVEKSQSFPSGEGVTASPSDEITDEEFEALLDKLHGDAKTSAGTANRPIDDGHINAAQESNHYIATKAASDRPNSMDIDDNPANLNAGHGVTDDGMYKAAPAKDSSLKTSRAHAGEERDKEEKKAGDVKDHSAHAQADTTVRVDTKRLDDIMNLVGELVLVRNRLETLKLNVGNDEVAQAVSNLDVVTSDLQSAVMKTRMQPIKKVFGRFPRVVRDLSRALKKDIDLELVGEETDLDKNLVEALADPLVHLVRNSVDHGIESPDIRQASGKSRVGKITLSAKQEGDHILLTIKDDGAGMNADKLRNKAIEKGLLDPDSASRLDERECYNLIFMPGFSTKAEISDISGRGVGMDVVKTRISQLNGNVEIDSKEGKGTEIKIKLPLTLAIVPTLMVVVGGQIFAIPLANVNEIIQYDSVRTNVVDGQTVAIVREHPLPLYFLRDWLIKNVGSEGISKDNSYIVVIQLGASHIACVVDHLISQEEVVIKPLGTLLHGLPGLAGATITGDGRIAIILDMPSLISRYGMRIR
jgi:two-component system, chemotaxis family, sensor kinase CheA